MTAPDFYTVDFQKQLNAPGAAQLTFPHAQYGDEYIRHVLDGYNVPGVAICHARWPKLNLETFVHYKARGKGKFHRAPNAEELAAALKLRAAQLVIDARGQAQ